MASERRTGTLLLGLGAIGLAGLMTYTLLFDYFKDRITSADRDEKVPEVAVFFPEMTDWVDFLAGVDHCRRKGLLKVESRSPTDCTISSPNLGRQLRFVWYAARGLRATREQVHSVANRSNPPVALIGSTTSVLTLGIAQKLRQEVASSSNPKDLPLLLIPWATAVEVERDDPSDGSVPLLDVYQGRSFRFCPNNRRQAELIVDCALKSDEVMPPPGRVYLVVDRKDLFSTDLADAFRRSISQAAPGAVIVEEPEVVSGQGAGDAPDQDELDLAENIWKQVQTDPVNTPTWVILPLQAQPCRRMLVALSKHAVNPANGKHGIRVLCGDGIGLSDLVTSDAEFPVMCVSPGVVPAKMADFDIEAKMPAELVATLAWILDSSLEQAFSAESLRVKLVGLDLEPESRMTLGRTIAFVPSGERKGDNLGYIMSITPGSTKATTLARDTEGDWSKLKLIPFAEATRK